MKKILLLSLLCGVFSVAKSQNCVLTEDFENLDSAFVSVPTWLQDPFIYYSDFNSINGTYNTADSAVLETNPVNLTGQTFVKLRFQHICKIEFFDDAIIEVSVDGGLTWVRLTGAQYLGGSLSFAANNKFTEVSYANWLPGQIVTPDNTWFQYEEFDISVLAGNQTDVRVRFNVKDKNNNGMASRYGWNIDDVCILAAPCELLAPTLIQLAPIYPSIIYNNGPFNVNADISDPSGIVGASLIYTINGGAPQTVAMTNPGGTSYTGQIPVVNTGDTVCYRIQANDSACFGSGGNIAYMPGPGTNDYKCFRTSTGATFPYCDSFDLDTLWSDSLIAGTAWELGTPAGTVTNTAHSAPNAWDINLNGDYVGNSNSELISPVFSFAGAFNAELDFWINYQSEGFWDGAHMEYSVDNGVTWQQFTNLNGTEKNWYVGNMNSCNCQGWNGNSNGWKNVFRVLDEPDLQNPQGPVKFKFVFTSDGIINGDGVSIDDFCLTLPPDIDMAMDSIVSPTLAAPAGDVIPITVIVQNRGLNAVTNFDVYYAVNNGTPVGPFNYNGSLLSPNDTISIQCGTYVVQTGPQDICYWVTIASDGKTKNDTLCFPLQGVPTVSLTYCDNFDGTALWSATPSPIGNTTWELGTPGFGQTNSAYSFPNAWDINLNSAYENSANTTLASPYFDMGLSSNSLLNFYQNRNTELNSDGFRIDYTTDGGANWIPLGTFGQGTNWYTNAFLFSSNQPGWDGNSNGWIKSETSLQFLDSTPLVQFRFVFTSDGFGTIDGVSIDDFCIKQPSALDAGVIAITQPNFALPANNLVPVEVTIRNFGSSTLTSIPVTYEFLGTPYTTTWTGTLTPNSTANVILSPNIIVPLGVNDICAYTGLPGDGDAANDSICKALTGIATFIPTYCDNFDTGSYWVVVPSTQGATEWELGTPNFGQTSSTHSGINSWDINLTTGYGIGANAMVMSPFFDMSLTNNADLSFWHNRNTATFSDGTRLEYSTDGGATWNILGSVGVGTNWYNQTFLNSSFQAGWDGSSGGWVRSEINMSAFNGTPNIQFRFVFTSDNFTGFGEDGFSFDDFCLRQPPPIDAGVTGIIQPGSGAPAGTLVPVVARVRNFGSNVLNSIPVTYEFLGTPYTTTWTGSLAPNGTVDVALTPNITLPQGQSTICAYTAVPNDGDYNNDTLCKQVIGIPTLNANYTDNFDGPNVGWTTSFVDPLTKWELGTPAFGATNSAHSAPNAWDVNLTTAYQPKADCYLFTPYFDFSNAAQAELRMWINYSTENNWDGARVDYTVDGVNWVTVGNVGQGTNWYTSASLLSSQKPGWAGSSGGWLLAKSPIMNALDYSATPVQFRIQFTADQSIAVDGFSIDDFNIFIPISLSAASVSVKPANNILTPGPQYITGVVKNKGTTKLDYCTVTLSIDGNVIVTDSAYFPVPIKLDSTENWVFSLPWNASPGPHTICMWTSFPNGTADLNTTDDTTCLVLNVFDSTSAFPYCVDFENTLPWVQLNALTYVGPTSWQLGNPNKPFVNGTHSGVKAWVTKVAGNYNSPDSSALFTPVMNIEAGRCYKVSFWHSFYTETFQDGGTLEYSYDSAKTWKPLGIHLDPNWFNTYYVAGFGGPPPTPGWTGNSGGWIQSSREFPAWYTGGLMMRFRFGSDNSFATDGWAIDDFCFEELPGPCTIVGMNDNPNQFAFLYQSKPNPATDMTNIEFAIPNAGKVVFEFTDVLGKTVMPGIEANYEAGISNISVDVKSLSSGIYYYTMKYADVKMVQKMLVVR